MIKVRKIKSKVHKDKYFTITFVVIFSIIGVLTIFQAIAVNEVKTVEAESIILSDGAKIENDTLASSGKFVSFRDSLTTTTPTTPTTPTTVACNPNRTVTVEDDRIQNSKLGFVATNTIATATEKNQIQTKINNEITKFIDNEISRGRLVYKSGVLYQTSNNTVFVPFQSIVGKVGIVQTNTEKSPQVAFSVKAGGFEAESHVGRFDPIVGPCQSSFGHEHVFFGNTKTDGYSTTTSLFNQKSTIHPMDPYYKSRGIPYNGEWIADSASYWMPAVYKNGKRLVTENLTFYYRPTGNSTSSSVQSKVQPMPLGLRMIVGNANYTGATASCIVRFQQFDNDANNTCGKTEMISVPAGKKIEFSMTYPSCWDGKRLNTPDQSHVVYPSGGKTSTACPSTHPVMIPQLNMIGNFAEGVSATDNFALSSGSFKTLHADFWNVWDPAIMKTLTEQVINKGDSAGGIHAALPN